ncbi:hypothetical protein CEXT_105861 [Caerostris extrusa]|uniref:Uncharacterized protein n=1 Tax=Caerostris extrusa TaxID=172846 RepID=A0AAV4UMP3_CAEEX|nr:hypothetical protein CEXT_105861 [Caerostris extrusa]
MAFLCSNCFSSLPTSLLGFNLYSIFSNTSRRKLCKSLTSKHLKTLRSKCTTPFITKPGACTQCHELAPIKITKRQILLLDSSLFKANVFEA